jgi:hypothetical protein
MYCVFICFVGEECTVDVANCNNFLSDVILSLRVVSIVREQDLTYDEVL